MNSDTQLIIYGILFAIFTFFFTFSFSYSYKIFQRSKISSYLKCLAGGIILSTLIFHIIPDIYEHESSDKWDCAPLCAGISFLFLFWIDKLYLEAQGEHDSLPDNATLKKAIIFVFALSIHSFLEGLGYAAKSPDKIIYYVIGLLGHKWAEAFALGVSIAHAPFKKRTALSLVLLYSILTPLGVLSGMALMYANPASAGHFFVQNVLNGCAGGSFFYIGFVEMLHSEFHSHGGKVDKAVNGKKLSAITAGFAVMSFVLIAMKAKGCES